MKNKKAILAGAVLCAAGLCAAGLAVPASPVNLSSLIQADDSAYNGFLYTVTDGNATITGYTEELDLTNVIIPDVIVEGDNEYPVTAIGDNAFKGSAAVNITVSDNVTSIGNYVFSRCKSLKNLKIGKNVTSVGSYFLNSEYSNQMQLDTITIPDNLKSIGSWSFEYIHIKSVIIPDTVAYVPSNITNERIVNFTVGENNENYSSIDGVLYNKDVTELIRCPRYTELTSYIVPDTVTTIGNKAFQYCSSIKNLNLGKNVTSIGNSAVESDINNPVISLETITIPDNLKNIGSSIFGSSSSGYNTKFLSVIIPESVVSVPSIITNWKSVTEFCVDDDNEVFTDIEGVLYSKDIKELIRCPISSRFPSYNVPDTVTKIGNNAFQYCSSIKNLNLGKNVTSIGNSAIESDINNPVISLETITIPDNLKDIGSGIFGSSSSGYNTTFSSVIIPESVVSIPSIITNWKSVTEFSVDENNEFFTDSDGVLYNKEITDLIRFPRSSKITTYVVPDTVTNIRDYAFQYCGNIRNLNLGKSVTSIGTGALYSDSNNPRVILNSITLPDNLSEIGSNLFGNAFTSGHAQIQSVIIPESVIYIAPVFKSCPELRKFTVDENNKLWTDDKGILYSKDMTELIKCPGSTELTSYSVSDNTTRIDEYAFYNCKNISELNLGKNVSVIQDGALATAGTIKKLTLPEQPAEISNNIFVYDKYDSTSVEHLIIPSYTTTVNPVFYNKGSLTEITVEEGSKHFACDEGILYSTDTLELLKCPVTTSLSKYDMLTNTEKITSGSFSSTKIINLLIPSTVKEIEEDAFKNGSLAKIRGISGSYAETYANENNIKFEAVDADPAKTLTATGTAGVTQPTASPSVTPTASASASPSAVPAADPTAAASPSGAPSTAPAATTSATPAATPSATASPSASPTAAPTAAASPSAAVTPSEVPSAVPSVQKGDVDGDGAVTTTDVKNILKHIVGKIKFTDTQTAGADINGDGAVNSADALLLLRTVTGSAEK